MSIEELTQIFGNLVFPIGAYVALFWYMTKLNDDHKEEMSTMRETVEANTLAVQRLTDHLEGKNG